MTLFNMDEVQEFNPKTKCKSVVVKTKEEKRLAARCNPSDPALAKQTLNEAVERVFKTLNEWDV